MRKLDSPLVSGEWLEAHLGDPSLRVLDATVFLDRKTDGSAGYLQRSGQKEYAEAHIPGASFIDLMREVSDTSSPFPFTMLPAQTFASRAAALGISQDSTVVIYSASSVMWSTRVWWMLRSIGFTQAAVLDGGWEKWQREQRPVTNAVTEHNAGNVNASATTPHWAAKAEVKALVSSPGSACLLDALSPQDYQGKRTPYGRPGHIPTSRNVFYHHLLDAETGCFLPVEKLKAILTPSGALTGARVVCYCGGGIASTMLALALTLCGQRNVAVFDGSMLEWAADKTLPLTLGEEP